MPVGPGASSQVRNWSATAFSAGTEALSPQSKARPSLCSLSAPMSQARVMPRSRPP